jgi:hypothetical protein
MTSFFRIAMVVAGMAVLKSTGAEPVDGSFAQPREPISQTNVVRSAELSLRADPSSIWENGVGDGFRKGVTEAGVSLGIGLGSRSFGGKNAHDLALMRLSLGRMVTGILCEDKCYQGNFELIGELFGGGQFLPNEAYLIGLTGVVRYNFVTGTRLVPFVDGGAGVAVTDIDHPDLSTKFQFNTQAGLGVRWFIDSRTALTAQYRFIHISNAAIKHPNLGVNTSMFYAGINWMF